MQKIRFDIFFKRLCDATTITSQANLAKSLSISRTAITQSKKNDSIPKKWIFELSQLYNLNLACLENGIVPNFSKQKKNQ
jgi:DNA-binding XRE family transcriptional regulator